MDDLKAFATGRMFIHDDVDVKLVNEVPDHDEWHLWTEYEDHEGFWYVSDHEDYTLDADEFGPIDDGMALTVDQVKEMGLL